MYIPHFAYDHNSLFDNGSAILKLWIQADRSSTMQAEVQVRVIESQFPGFLCDTLLI